MKSLIYHPETNNNHAYNTRQRTCSKSYKRSNICSNSKTFWLKHCRVVSIDVSEVLDRIFCACGLVPTFQEAFTLTVLDKRAYAPPIESPWQRLVNMANACETFGVSSKSVAELYSKGFRSLTLLSLCIDVELHNFKMPVSERKCLEKCLKDLNNRTKTALEPLHSLRRLVHEKRKNHFENNELNQPNQELLEYLDLANFELKKICNKQNYKQPTPMIARSSFKTYDSYKILGPIKACHCIKTTEVLRSPSVSSGYSSSNPNSPDFIMPANLYQFQVSPARRPNHGSPSRVFFPSNPRNNFANPVPKGQFYKKRQNFYEPQKYRESHQSVNCPFLDCTRKITLSEVDNHCKEVHNLGPTGKSIIINKEFPWDSRIAFTMSAEEIIKDNGKTVWWGPKQFTFDNVTFYQIIYKSVDEFTQKSWINFWIWSTLPTNQARKYSYEIHLDIPPQHQTHHNVEKRRHYAGMVQSLEIPLSDMITDHVRSIVYFAQNYLRKCLFNRLPFNSHNPQTDIKYSVKIMRQS